MMALALRSGLRRSSNGFRITYIDAQLDALPPPAGADVGDRVGHAGVVVRDLVHTGHDIFGEFQRFRIGQLEAGDQSALVHLGDEPRRHHGKGPAG